MGHGPRGRGARTQVPAVDVPAVEGVQASNPPMKRWPVAGLKTLDALGRLAVRPMQTSADMLGRRENLLSRAVRVARQRSRFVAAQWTPGELPKRTRRRPRRPQARGGRRSTHAATLLHRAPASDVRASGRADGADFGRGRCPCPAV